eukprot:10353541-Karenia_brevis.AAC.1
MAIARRSNTARLTAIPRTMTEFSGGAKKVRTGKNTLGGGICQGIPPARIMVHGIWEGPDKFKVIKSEKSNIRAVASGKYRAFAIEFVVRDGEVRQQGSFKHDQPMTPATS